ncbi:hypothetical protein BCV69DRAFT_279527 [Microstroma glucosiphilum]|uniref:Uncharacterized protein n=1 Tax=Pseudomicrostroma glucosiphilum TaxID=1684307 RepID=A0A316UE92_9BASI|nr:hypothetical protein BCV69DRAFT_279527 [Pseudomicrostroma glucosiphilum]PWN23597.1 hypothetical protein BCV69DRAFT_279527 [Pseudomicrostroma glucosiphilum]
MAAYPSSATASSSMTHRTPFEEITVKSYLETVVWPSLPTYGKVNARWSNLGNPSLNADHWPQAEALHTLPRSYAEVSMFYELVVQYFTGRVKAFLEGDVLPPLSISDITDLDRQLQQAWTASINEHLLLRAEFIQSFINSCIKPMGPHNCLLKIAFGELFSAEHFSTPLMPLYPRFGAFTRDAANTEGPTAWRTVSMPEPRYSALDPTSYMAAWASAENNIDLNHWHHHGLVDNKLGEDGSEMQAVTIHEVLNTPASRVDLFKMLCATTLSASSSSSSKEHAQANPHAQERSSQQDHGQQYHEQKQLEDQAYQERNQHTSQNQRGNGHQQTHTQEPQSSGQHYNQGQQHHSNDPSYPAFMEPAVPQWPSAMPNVAFSPAHGSNHFSSRGSTPPLGSFHSTQSYPQASASGSYDHRSSFVGGSGVSNGLHHSYPTSSGGLSIGAPTPPPHAQYGAASSSSISAPSATTYTSNLRSSLHSEISGSESPFAPSVGHSYHVASYAQGPGQGTGSPAAGTGSGSGMGGDGYYGGSYASQSRYTLPPSSLSPHHQSNSLPHWSERSSFSGHQSNSMNGSMAGQRVSPSSSLKRSYFGSVDTPPESKRSRFMLEDGGFAGQESGAQYPQPYHQQYQHHHHQQPQHLREAYPGGLRATEAGYSARSPVNGIKGEMYSPSVGAGASGKGSESSRGPSPSPSLSNGNGNGHAHTNGNPTKAGTPSGSTGAGTPTGGGGAAARPTAAGVKDRAQQNREKMKRYAARVKRQREALKLVFEEVQSACEVRGFSFFSSSSSNSGKMDGAATINGASAGVGASKKGRGSANGRGGSEGSEGLPPPPPPPPPHFATAAEKLNYQKRASKARKRSSEQDHLDRIVEVAKEACCRHGNGDGDGDGDGGANASADAGTGTRSATGEGMQVAIQALCEVLQRRTDLWEDLIEAERRLSSNTNSNSNSNFNSNSSSTSSMGMGIGMGMGNGKEEIGAERYSPSEEEQRWVVVEVGGLKPLWRSGEDEATRLDST